MLPCGTGRYLEQERNLVLVAGSVTVQFVSSQHHMHIDQATMQALELTQPIKAGFTSKKKSSTSLFGCAKQQTLSLQKFAECRLHCGLQQLWLASRLWNP